MDYILKLEYLFEVEVLGIIFEMLFITTCVATILYFVTKSQYISLLAAPIIFYLISSFQLRETTHLFFLLVAMLIQGIIIVTIQYQSSKNPVILREDRLSSF